MATNIREINNSIVLLQRGNGTPTHISTRSTLFFDLDSPLVYINKDGAATWDYLLDSSMVITGGTSGDTFVSGFTYDNQNNITIHRNDGVNLSININVFTGLTVGGAVSATTFYGDGSHLSGISGISSANYYTTGSTLVNTIAYFNRNDTLSAYTLDLSSFITNDTYVTGGTYTNGTATFTNNTGGTFNVSGFSTGNTEVFVTGGTPNNITRQYTFTNNTGGTFNVNSILDIYVISGSYASSTGIATFTNNTGGTFTVTGFYTNSNDIYTTGITNSNNLITLTNNTGGTISTLFNTTSGLTNTGLINTATLSAITITASTSITSPIISATTYQGLPTDIRVTGGSFSNTVKVLTFTNNTGGTFTVTGLTDAYVTGGTGSNTTKQYTFTNSTGGTFNVLSITDIYVTGGTYTAGTATFTNNTGGTFTVNGFYTNSNDIFVTGGTGNNTTKIYTFTNNTGGTFNVLSITDIYVTGITNSNNLITLTNNTGGTTSTLLNTVTGLTASGLISTGSLSAVTISATTYVGLPTDIRITGSTFVSNILTLTNNTGGTVNVLINNITGLTNSGLINTATLSAITLTASTSITSPTISATTYQGLPTDIRITGGSYNATTDIITFTNNTGGTFTVTGITDTFVTGATYSSGTGIATFTNNTGGTFTVSGFYTNANDIFVTGITNSNNLITLTNNTGGTTSTLFNTVSGLTINGNINFVTGNTIPTNISGRVFYNTIEQALAYYPNSNQDVIVNIGQQQYIRVNNVSGSIINKGSVVKAVSASGGTPSITLAISTGFTGNNLIGLAAHNINTGSQGLVLTNGLLSGLTVNTFNIGDVIYLSDTIAGGYINNTTSLAITSRINEIGYITATGTTTGQIFVNINNENSNELLTIKEKNLLGFNSLSTGVYIFTGLTKVSNTIFSIAPVSGWIVKNAGSVYALSGDVVNVQYTGSTGMTTPYLATYNITYVLVTSANTITLQTTFPTESERRNNIYLGKVVHTSRISIEFVLNSPDFDVSPISQLRDIMEPIKLINSGIYNSSNGTNLNFNTNGGTLYGLGIGWVNDSLTPDSVIITDSTPTTFQYRTQTGGTNSDTTFIIPGSYDVGGVITAIPGSVIRASNQRVYLYPNGTYRVQYGQDWYSNLTNAITSIQTESFVVFDNLLENAILIGILSVRKNATDLSDLTQAKFTLVSKFGEILGGTGGIATTTLQQAYDNSIQPEILIDATRDGLTIQNGTGNADNITHLLEGANTAGVITSFIRADGGISGTSITGTSISATTYLNLPTDIRITGGTFNNNTDIITFTNNTGGTFTVTGFTDTYVTGGTGNNITKQYTFTNSTGGTFNVNSILDVYVTGITNSNNLITLTNNTGGTISTLFNTTSGLTNTGLISTATLSAITLTASTSITSPTISASTYQGLPTDIRVTGSSLTNNIITLTNNTGGTINTLINNLTGLTITGGITASPLQKSYAILDVRGDALIGFGTELTTNGGFVGSATGWTLGTNWSYSANSAQASGLTSGQFLYQNNNIVTGHTYLVSVDVVVTSGQIRYQLGGTAPDVALVSGHNVQYYNTRTTAGSIIFLTTTNFTGTITNVSVKELGNLYVSTGGTVGIGTTAGTYSLTVAGAGTISATTSISTPTISATTYLNLPTDIRVTGGTYSNGNTTFTNNTGGTFTVSGFTTGNNITGITNNNNLITLTNNTGGTISTLFNTTSGLTNTGLISTATLSAITLTASTSVRTPKVSIIGVDDVIPGLGVLGGKLNILNTTLYGMLLGEITTGDGFIQQQRIDGTATAYNLLLQPSGGNVGIGTTAPIRNLEVSSSTGATIRITSSNASVASGETLGGVEYYSNDSSGVGYGVVSSIRAQANRLFDGVVTSGADLIFSTKTYGGGLLDNMILLAGGNVGIGTTLPTAKLHVLGDIISTGLTNSNLISTGSLSAVTISATTYVGLPTDIRVTGGTGSNTTKIYTFTNNTGGTFNVLSITDVYVTGTSFANNILTLTNNTGGTTSVLINSFTGLTATTISASTYQNLPNVVSFTGITNSNNLITLTNSTGGTISTLFNTVSGLTINGNLTVTGNTSLQGTTGTSLLLSASTTNLLNIIGSGTTSPIVRVQGSQGELFSITDSLIGSLYSVNDISGLPIFEVFSDDTILMGSYLAPSLNTTVKVIANSGSGTTVYSIPTSAYTSAFFEYSVSNNSSARAGNIMSIWSGSGVSINYTETTTTDLGNTSGLTFNMIISGTSAMLIASAATNNWTVKTIVRSI